MLKMVTKISKFIGIPASLKTAKKQMSDLINDKETSINHEPLVGKYLCIKKIKERGGYTGFVTTYPIYISKNKIKGSIKCRKVLR